MPSSQHETLLVTGANGFVGRYVFAASEDWKARFGYAPLALPHGVDVRDAVAVDRVIAEAKPAAVLHLAAQANVPQSFQDPRGTYEVNVLGTLTLVQAVKRHVPTARILLVSSGDVYGQVAEADLPIVETRAPAPRNPYAASKVAAEVMLQQWQLSEGLHALIARPFNHIGPGQSEAYAVATFARQIAEIAAGKRPPKLDVGNLDVTRDFTDVREVVHAYGLLLRNGIAGEIYNVCSGVEVTLSEIVCRLLDCARVKVDIVVDPARVRPSEQRRVRGSNAKIATLGWKPSIPLNTTLADLYASARDTFAVPQSQ